MVVPQHEPAGLSYPGLEKNKIFPDFIAANKSNQSAEYDTVYVLETKGIHLKSNEDTLYKKNVMALCTELGTRKAWKELFDEFPDHDFEFQVVNEEEWQRKINGILEK
jgi:type III restriction enzyme